MWLEEYAPLSQQTWHVNAASRHLIIHLPTVYYVVFMWLINDMVPLLITLTSMYTDTQK